jgi:hypothetical protein
MIKGKMLLWNSIELKRLIHLSKDQMVWKGGNLKSDVYKGRSGRAFKSA